jgi:hypothetical protein
MPPRRATASQSLKDPKQNSTELYLKTYINLIKKADTEDINKILEWVKNQNSIKTRTKLNYLNAIVSLHKHKPATVKGNIGAVKKARDDYQKQVNDDVAKSNVTDRQKVVMDKVKWKDVEDTIEALDKKKDGGETALEDYILVSLMVPPLRNDLQDIKVVKTKPPAKNRTNHILVTPKKVTLSILDHKTTSRGGKPIIREISGDLATDIRKLVGDGREVLFTDRSGKAYTSSGFTHRLNSIFRRHTGVNISSTLLRKLYLSNKYGATKSIQKEMAKDAEAMGHSVTTQQEHYVADGGCDSCD